MSLPEAIELTLLLSGGQQQALTMRSDDPLLQELYKVLLDLEGKRTKQLFQIPVQQGQAVLTFPCDRLVGLVTEPPITVEYRPSLTIDTKQGARAIQELSTTKIDTQPATPRSIQELSAPKIETQTATIGAATDVLLSHFVQLDNFFNPKEHQKLLDFVARQQANFVSTTTSLGDLDYRKSVVLHKFPEFSNLITKKIRAIFPDIIAQLNMPYFDIAQIESQLTAHNDGHYYKTHNDNGSPDSATRELTYVYYFHNQPKAFSGGQLKIYDSRIENNFYVKADSSHIIEPRDNSIVFFPSRYMHEVLPIACPSRKFADGRFTINGWLRK